MGNCRTERPPDPILYGGRPSGGFVNRAANGDTVFPGKVMSKQPKLKETRRKINFDEVAMNNNATVRASERIRSRSNSQNRVEKKGIDNDFVWGSDAAQSNTHLAIDEAADKHIAFVLDKADSTFDGVDVMVENDDLDYEYDSSDQDISGDSKEQPVVTEVTEMVVEPRVVSPVGNDVRNVVDQHQENLVDINNLSMEQMMRILNLRNFVRDNSRVSQGETPGTSSLVLSKDAHDARDKGPGNCDMDKVADQRIVNGSQNNQIKSPSDTTIYAPALNKRFKVRDLNNHLLNVNNLGPDIVDIRNGGMVPDKHDKHVNSNIMETISNFIESIQTGGPQIERGSGESIPANRGHNHDEVVDLMPREKSAPPEFEQVRLRAEEKLLDVERFKAKLTDPPGRLEVNLPQTVVQNVVQITGLSGMVREDILDIRSGVSDDDFFHLTCHIEPSLIHKIEKGEFVELEKLLPKHGRYKGSGDDN